MNKNKQPHQFAEWILKRISWHEDRNSILENLREEYEHRLLEQGKLYARGWYWLHVFRFNNMFATYVLLKEGFDYKKLDAKFPEFVTRHL